MVEELYAGAEPDAALATTSGNGARATNGTHRGSGTGNGTGNGSVGPVRAPAPDGAADLTTRTPAADADAPTVVAAVATLAPPTDLDDATVEGSDDADDPTIVALRGARVRGRAG